MTNPGAIGASAGAIGMMASIANAIKASGAIISVEPNDFLAILSRNRDGVVVQSPPGFFTKHKYLTSYKGLIFYTKTSSPLTIPASVEVVGAKKIWVPEM